MCFDVLPEGFDDLGTGLHGNSQEFGQSWVQLELHGLMVQQQQNGALDVHTAGTFNLLKMEKLKFCYINYNKK